MSHKKPGTMLILIEQNNTFFREMSVLYHGKENTHSRIKEKLFKQYFDITGILRESHNLPPAYVYILKNQNK